MTPQTQKYKSPDASGHSGDCYRTALASLLDMDRDDVPHFYDLPAGCLPETLKAADAWRRRWLRENGYDLVNISLCAEDPTQAMEALSRTSPQGMRYLLIGESKNGCGHAVIVRDGEIEHDPSQDQSGIVGPDPSSGCYWAEFVVRGSVVT